MYGDSTISAEAVVAQEAQEAQKAEEDKGFRLLLTERRQYAQVVGWAAITTPAADQQWLDLPIQEAAEAEEVGLIRLAPLAAPASSLSATRSNQP
jgi:hypothetical protein